MSFDKGKKNRPIRMINDTNTAWSRKGKTLALTLTATARRLGERLRQIFDTYGANKNIIDEKREEEIEEEESGQFGFNLHGHSFCV